MPAALTRVAVAAGALAAAGAACVGYGVLVERDWYRLRRERVRALEPAELARLVDEAVASSGASGPRELGKVMGRLMPQVRGRADGNEVRRLVLERLGGNPG